MVLYGTIIRCTIHHNHSSVVYSAWVFAVNRCTSRSHATPRALLQTNPCGVAVHYMSSRTRVLGYSANTVRTNFESNAFQRIRIFTLNLSAGGSVGTPSAVIETQSPGHAVQFEVRLAGVQRQSAVVRSIGRQCDFSVDDFRRRSAFNV